MRLIGETKSSPAILYFSSSYFRKMYSMASKITMRHVYWWTSAKSDCNGHVSIMAVLVFNGGTATLGKLWCV